MAGLDWLTGRPVAHRGLHDAAAGIVENSASAFSAAAAGPYAIECDLQIAADGEAMVFHDDTLERLTERAGALALLTSRELKAVAFKATADRMMTLGELCDLVAGRVTLVLEVKSHFDGDTRLAARVAEHYGAKVVDYGPESLMLRVYGDSDKLDAFLALLGPLGLSEVVRSGKILMARGTRVT